MSSNHFQSPTAKLTDMRLVTISVVYTTSRSYAAVDLKKEH